MTSLPRASGAPREASTGPASHRLEVEGLSSGYRGKRVLVDVSFTVSEPAIYVVLGPNGAGKTTLFRTLAGILDPYDGKVMIDGIDARQAGDRVRLQYLSHIDGFPDGLRVDEGLRFYAGVEGASEEDVERVVALLGMGEWRRSFFSQLSAGQRKRASLARVFLQERGIYLLDEITSNLDPKLAREIRDLVLALSRNDLVLYSSHNLFEAKEIGKYVLVLRNGKLDHFGLLSELRPSRYVVGIRTDGPEEALPASTKQGDYYVQELAGPEEVPKLVAELVAKGVRIREVKEMGNPLEEIFA
jgi:ABC-2 type transport system ATP-binding protein